MNPSQPTQYLLSPGSRGRAVRVVKELLHLHPRIRYSSDRTDEFNQTLANAVAAYQDLMRLASSRGTVDAATWRALGMNQPPVLLQVLTGFDSVLLDLLSGVQPAGQPGAAASSANFIIVHGDPGRGAHHVGALFEWSAATHEKEVKANSFAGVPSLGGATVKVVHCSTVTDLVKAVSVGNVAYLAYFGHSWTRSLLIGQRDAADTNLSNRGRPNDTPVSRIPKSSFAAKAQLRLFGCKAGFGSNSIAEQMAKGLGVTVFAYDNPNGSLFTQAADLGHGRRVVKDSDKKAGLKPKADTWMVPLDGKPTFNQFP